MNIQKMKSNDLLFNNLQKADSICSIINSLRVVAETGGIFCKRKIVCYCKL